MTTLNPFHNFHIRIILVVVLFFPYISSASTKQVSTSENQSLEYLTTSSPLKFLQHLRGFISDSNIDDYQRVENFLNQKKENWGKPRKTNGDFLVYPPNLSDKAKNLRFIFDKHGNLSNLNLEFKEKDPSCVILPKFTREILGPPSGVLADNRNLNILYTYETKQFEVKIWFTADPITHNPPIDLKKMNSDLTLLNHHNQFYAYRIFIERKQYDENYSSKAKKIHTNAPKTPKDLLSSISLFLHNANIDQIQFAEHIFGTPIGSWGLSKQHYTKNNAPQDYSPYESTSTHNSKYKSLFSKYSLYGVLRAGGYNPPDIPYESSRIIIDNQNDIKVLNLHFFRYKNTFRLTPKLTREILGIPQGFHSKTSTSTRNYSGTPITSIFYIYETTKYEIKIRFEDKTNYRSVPTKFGELISDDEIRATTQYLKNPLNHKNFSAINVRIEQKKYPRSYSTWAKNFESSPIKSPKHLLLKLKGIHAAGNEGTRYCEEVSGIPQKNWGKPEIYKQHDNYNRYYNEPYQILKRGGYNPPPLPYELSSQIDQDDIIRRLEIKFNNAFCLTPANTREILGDPSHIRIKKPYMTGDCIGVDFFVVKYYYQLNSYSLQFSYPAKKIELIDRNNLKERQQKHKQLKIYNNHKNICATKIKIVHEK